MTRNNFGRMLVTVTCLLSLAVFPKAFAQSPGTADQEGLKKLTGLIDPLLNKYEAGTASAILEGLSFGIVPLEVLTSLADTLRSQEAADFMYKLEGHWEEELIETRKALIVSFAETGTYKIAQLLGATAGVQKMFLKNENVANSFATGVEGRQSVDYGTSAILLAFGFCRDTQAIINAYFFAPYSWKKEWLSASAFYSKLNTTPEGAERVAGFCETVNQQYAPAVAGGMALAFARGNRSEEELKSAADSLIGEYEDSTVSSILEAFGMGTQSLENLKSIAALLVRKYPPEVRNAAIKAYAMREMKITGIYDENKELINLYSEPAI